MAITILQEPTSPNLANTELIYSISSSNAGNPQFRYVVDIAWAAGGSFNLDTTFRVYPNLNFTGNFDISRYISDDYLGDTAEYDFNTWFVGPSPLLSSGVMDQYLVEFKEEYASDLNSTPYTSSVLASDIITVLPEGFKNINDNTGTGYNFDSGSYYYDGGPAKKVKILTTNPSTFTGTDDIDFVFSLPLNAGCPVNVIQDAAYALTWYVDAYGFNDTLIAQDSYTYAASTSYPAQRTINVGPAALTNIAIYPNISTQINAGNVKYIYAYASFTSNKLKMYVDYQCDYDNDPPYTIGWIGQLGTLEVFSPGTPLRKVTNINRKEYDRTFVRYEDFLPSYNQSNRGKTTYTTEYSDTYEFTTDWLNEEQAQWLSGLFESNQVVFNISPDKFYNDQLPVTITNSSYTVNNSTSRNKLFQYTVQFKYSLDRHSR